MQEQEPPLGGDTPGLLLPEGAELGVGVGVLAAGEGLMDGELPAHSSMKGSELHDSPASILQQ